VVEEEGKYNIEPKAPIFRPSCNNLWAFNNSATIRPQARMSSDLKHYHLDAMAIVLTLKLSALIAEVFYVATLLFNVNFSSMLNHFLFFSYFLSYAHYNNIY